MVRPGVVGPFRAVGRVVSGGAERIAVQVSLHDEGKDDRVISVANSVFRAVG
jgi:acyl-coenzyme A thioesterase PaaI-like protein